MLKVPNAPCGVESEMERVLVLPFSFLFLMHRVELKDTNSKSSFSSKCLVPNAPCGVESLTDARTSIRT